SSSRLPSADGLPIVRELLRRDEDANDQHIPLLLWWAVEDRALSDREQVLAWFDAPQTWQAPLVRNGIVERLGRRYLAEGTDAGLTACARLLDRAPGTAEVQLLVRGM